MVPLNRQHGTVADRHVAGVVGDGRQVEHEVVRSERCRVDAIYRDRLAIAERDHRVAVGVVGRIGLDVTEVGEAGIADQIDLISGRIVVVDDVVVDRLRQYQQVGSRAAGQSTSPDKANMGEPAA